MTLSIQRLGTAPTPEAIDAWMQELGPSRTVVGTSLQGRELRLYELNNEKNIAADVPTVLFLSLVHGNEPMGLLSLLFAAQLLHQASSLRGRSRSLPARVLFFPIVNIDAYTLNLKSGQGCRRTNLQSACEKEKIPKEPVSACPKITQDGVDLNRNFPADWEGKYASLRSQKTCTFGYHGPTPFSEPETQAIRDVVLKHNVNFVMSFHSRSKADRPPLLIHPYTSSRPLKGMASSQIQRYQEWSDAMNPSHTYITGTAQQAIQYTAGGSTVDWMQSINITAFVLESTPPCNNRWCPQQVSRAMHTARRDGVTARRFVELIVHGDIVEDRFSLQRFWIMAFLAVAAWFLVRKGRHCIVSALRRLRAKEKQVTEMEVQRLALTQ